MYSVHLKEELSTLRVFNSTGSYDSRSVPIFSCTVHYISDTEVYICNAVGLFSRSILRTIEKELNSKGFTKCTYERRGEIKVIV